MSTAQQIAFLGAGRMATALAKGIIEKGGGKSSIAAYDVSKEAAAAFLNTTCMECETADMGKTLSPADIVILAVKPQNVEACLTEARRFISGKLLISIAAGVKIATIAKLSGCDRIVRAMPNTPALVGEGATAIAHSKGASLDDVEKARALLSSVGEVLVLAEHLLDAVTGLSGSGPAYVFDFIQGLVDGGVRAGLPRDAAFKLAVKTVLGSVRLLEATGEHPAVLRDQVTSPGGTTAKGLSVLEKGCFRGTVAEAVFEAANRSRELGGS